MIDQLVSNATLSELDTLHRRFTATEPTVDVDDSLERATASAAYILMSLVSALKTQHAGSTEDEVEEHVQKAIWEVDILRSNLGA
ncbi:hypothetical protein LWC34_30365 [Kibdelosporangium philippinense]|uniref:Uncharacterized protein n=2 Tax=Kibdelosporangium philippinense TaxID=211113 RepID=A0ABS8ZH10_9PSEU|nr:hypothetical protein [Kibdelosporangium philippinense]MCE7007101.1 hypothetical protein [Kibdelosporangium philippinense]